MNDIWKLFKLQGKKKKKKKKDYEIEIVKKKETRIMSVRFEVGKNHIEYVILLS